MVHSCALSSELDQEGYEQTLRALKRCCSKSQNLHPYLRQDMPFIVAQLIQVADKNLTCRDTIVQGLLDHDLIMYALERILRDIGKIDEIHVPRLAEAFSKFVNTMSHLPSFVSIISSQPCVDFVLDLFSEPRMQIGLTDFAAEVYRFRLRMTREDFSAKVVPKVLDKSSKALTEGYSLSSAILSEAEVAKSYICVAQILDRFGHVHSYSKLASVVVKLFDCEENSAYLQLYYDDWVFLQKMFSIPEFRSKLIAISDLTAETFTRIYTIFSGSLSAGLSNIDTDDALEVVFSMSSMRYNGKMRVVMKYPTLFRMYYFPKRTYRDFLSKFGSDATSLNKKDLFETSLGVENESDANEIMFDADATQATSAKNVVFDTNKDEADKESFPEPENDKEELFFFQCCACGRKGNDLLRCGRCEDALYCNQACQKLDWKRGHKTVCKPLVIVAKRTPGIE